MSNANHPFSYWNYCISLKFNISKIKTILVHLSISIYLVKSERPSTLTKINACSLWVLLTSSTLASFAIKVSAIKHCYDDMYVAIQVKNPMYVYFAIRLLPKSQTSRSMFAYTQANDPSNVASVIEASPKSQMFIVTWGPIPENGPTCVTCAIALSPKSQM